MAATRLTDPSDCGAREGALNGLYRLLPEAERAAALLLEVLKADETDWNDAKGPCAG